MPSKDENKTSEYYDAKLPYCVVESVNGSPKIGVSIENDIANGTVFGAWRINKYSNPDLIVDMVEKESKAQCVSDIKNVYTKVKPGFLDPYYNKAGKKKIEQYKKTILLNIQSNAEAFLRNVLLYLRKMICDGLIISEIDIVAKDFDTIYADLVGTTATQPNTNVFSPIRPGTISSTPLIEALKELGFDNKELDKLLQDIKGSACRSFCARLVYPFLMAITQNSDEIYSMYKSRDYSALNGMIGYVENGGNITESRVEVIKFLSALGGINLTLVNSNEKEDTVSASQKYMNSLLKDIFIEASEDPRTYLLHSFYDMLCNDKRGRLVRAFPTYYIVFVDEGRKMGSWKLHDNFYNMNSISSINVVKSRKIATDVCTIVMNNTFNSYTMEADSTTTQQYTDIYGLRDVFDSIFSPKAYFEKEKRIRLRKTIPDTVVLQPGIRIHVRMGYSGDGSKLPIVFNGKVAELDVNEVATIVAQGDGHELMNPLNAFGEIEALSLDPAQSKITWFKDFRGSLAKGGESPRDLLAKVLTAKYGGLKKWIDTTFDGRWFNDNPFGIMHFGDPKFIDIFEQGELVQNLYEVADSTLLKGINEFATATTSKKITPTINTSLQDKTFWDLLHLAANSGTGYIGAIRDFGMRSTVFLGKPNHYYAYAYELVDNKIVEKRKPFQQFHYFDSYTDIVYNSIKASEAQMKTNAVGIWQSTNFWWGREESTVGPIYLDMNIYPEYQKSMTVDTGLLGSGNGGIDLGFTNHFGEKWSTNANDDKVNKSLAWRVTANTLRDSVKDMYQGDVCVLGDPSVKPYDRVYIHDTYEDMMGMFEVEAVIHNMSAETGFTTSVMPDVIARHEDTFESSVQSLMNTAGGMIRLGVALPIINKLWATAVHGKLATVIGKSNVLYNKSNKLAEMARNFSEVTGMKDFLDDKPTAKALFKSLDIFPDIHSINLEGFNDAIKYLSKLDASKISKYDNLATALVQFNKLNDDKYIEAIRKAYNNNKFGAAQASYTREQLETIVDNIITEKTDLDRLYIDLKKFNHKQFADDILKVTVDSNKLNQLTSLEVKKIIDKWTAEGVTASLDDVAKVMSDKEILKAINSKALKVDSVDDFFTTFKKMFSKVDGDNITTFAKAAKKLKGGAFLDDLIYVFKGLVKTNWVSLLIDLVIEASLFVMTKNAQEVFTRFLKSIQAVDVYPLKKNNKPLIAGMNGHKGSVYGYPVQEGYDSIQGMVLKFADTFRSTCTKLGGEFIGGGIADWIKNVLVDEATFNSLAEEWRYDLGIDMSAQMSEEELSQAVYSNVSAMYAANNQQGYSLATVPRISESDLKVTNIIQQFQVVNILPTAIPYNKTVVDMRFIINDPVVAKAMSDGRFKVAHTKKSDYAMNIAFETGVQTVPVKVSDNIIDMPLVREELLVILNHLLTHENLKDDVLTFTSGLRVNDKTSWKSTGYQMILKTKRKEILETVLKEYKESTEIIKDGSGMFKYTVKDNKATIIALAPSADVKKLDIEEDKPNE